MPDVALDGRDLATALSAWELGGDVSVRPYGRGMNSATWMVSSGSGQRGRLGDPLSAAVQFDAGLAVAAHLEAGGLPAGAPRPTSTGARSVEIAGHQLALLRFVAGREIDPTNSTDLRRWGETLGRAHHLLRDMTPPAGVQHWHWVDPEATHLDVERKADYFARRIAHRDLTGIDEPAENAKGLADARSGLDRTYAG